MPEQSEPILRRPASYEQLAAEIRSAASEQRRVHVQGSASTALPGDAAPAVTLSTLRLNKIVEHAVADMTVIVQAGITLEALQRHLAWRDQWLPVDPPATGGRPPGQRTIGGLIATNALGPLRFAGAEGGGGGDWRLLIMGMKTVDASGTLIRAGGRTVKNVAGYAMHRLHIGARGSLGAIAEVTLRTFARPVDERCVILFCPTPAHAESLLAQTLFAPVTPAYIEIVGGQTFAANPLQLPAPPVVKNGKPTGAMAVIVGFLGRPEACAGQIEIVRALPAAQELESIAQTAAQAGRLRLWMTSEPAPPEGAVSFRMYLKSSRVAAAVAQLEASGGQWIVSEAATGIVRGVVAGTDPAGVLSVLATEFAATVVAPPRLVLAAPDIHRRIKQALDPLQIFGAL